MTHALICRSSQETACFLLPPSYAQQAMLLAPGQLLYFGGGEPTLTTAPLLSDADLRLAARGRPPRPYTPWLLASALQLPSVACPPTTRIPAAPPLPAAPPRPAPPTERLPLPTVPEQIVELLTLRRDWLTSSEIAQALGLDLKVIQNALADLHRLRMVERRKPTRNVPEKFEYAAHPPTHPRISRSRPNHCILMRWVSGWVGK